MERKSGLMAEVDRITWTQVSASIEPLRDRNLTVSSQYSSIIHTLLSDKASAFPKEEKLPSNLQSDQALNMFVGYMQGLSFYEDLVRQTSCYCDGQAEEVVIFSLWQTFIALTHRWEGDLNESQVQQWIRKQVFFNRRDANRFNDSGQAMERVSSTRYSVGDLDLENNSVLDQRVDLIMKNTQREGKEDAKKLRFFTLLQKGTLLSKQVRCCR